MRFQDLLKSAAIVCLTAALTAGPSFAQTSTEPTPEQALQGLYYVDVADMAYNPSKMSSDDGWVRVGDALDLIDTSWLASVIHDFDAFRSGFKAGIYQKEDEYVIAFAGTDSGVLTFFKAPGDWANNIVNALGLPTIQYTLAGKIAEAAVKEYPGVTFVGHSLGGGLAQYAALETTNNAVVFNAAGSPILKVWRPDLSDRLIAFNAEYDPAANSGYQLGTEYFLPDTGHKLVEVKQALLDIVDIVHVDWPQVKLFQGGALALISSNVSHIGSTAGTGSLPQGSSYNSGNEGLFVSASPLAETQWFLIVGDAATHLGEHDAFGSIASPGGDPIFSLNNAGFTNTVIEKYFTLPAGQNTFSFSTFADFVTTEFPEFVGSQFDDTGAITLITPAGETFNVTTIFSESVNASNFSPVSDLPSPMLKETGAATGGHTGFETVSVPSLRVAPGGTVTLRVEVENVGDTLYPSAVLISGAEAR